ncbi:unnamed protein product [Sympodiomycopsis kandeliae]
MNSSVFRSRRAQGNANAPHDQLLDPLLTDDQRRAALKNGQYTGEDSESAVPKQRDAIALPSSTHGLSPTADGGVMIALFVVAAALRFWQIGHPDQVVFDEVHFGKFASYYLRREYYFDVHPPFAKMLNAFAGYLAGFPGNFDFENIGDKYSTANVPYVKLRALPAILGSFQVPLVFAIMRETGHARAIAVLSSAFILFDNAHIAQDRLILLDAALCLFMTLALYSYIKFYKQRYNEFSFQWWTWMISTGVNLALTMSCKMVGLLTFFTIGSAVIVDLWKLLDVKRGLTMPHILKHFFARALGLIVVPIFVYLFWFWAHFKVLTRSGPGDSFMSSQFQETLEGNPMLAQAKTVHYGDQITIKHKQTNAFLHSHLDRYPLKYDDGRISSQGQQVTGYPFNDTNNVWQVVPTVALPEESGPARIVRNGHIVRLLHVNTQSYLLTHDVASPLMSTNEEFTTVAMNETSRYNDTLFELQIAGTGKGNTDPWKSKSSWFKLIHVPTRVAMWTYSETPLPDWAFKQQEVNGIKNVNEKTTLWFVDDLEPDKESDDYEERSKPVPPRPIKHMSFFKKFIELQLQMLQQNAGLTQSHPYATGPINWPFLLQGISFWTQNEGQKQIYLMGNLIGWWSGILLVSVFIGILGADTLARRRGLEPISSHVRNRLGNTIGFFVSGWVFHYLPFFLMNRQLFLHHYLPAHICAVMAAGGILQFIFIEEISSPLSNPGPLLAPSFKAITTSTDGIVLSRPINSTEVVLPKPAKIVIAVLLALTVAMFVFLAPLTYGTPGLTSQQVATRKLLSTWTLHFMPSASDAAK